VPPPPRVKVLYTAASLKSLFSTAMIGRLAAMCGEDAAPVEGLPQLESLVVVDWPQGKHGHLDLPTLPACVEVLQVDDVADDSFRDAVVNADIVVADTVGHVIESRQALESVLDAEYLGTKTLIAITNILSWARTEVRPDEVLCEEDYVRRLGHPNHSELQDFEKRVARGHDDYLRTHVLCAGALYGCGEDIFGEAFKAAWEGRPVSLPLLPNEGHNIIPTIHCDDLVSMVTRLLLPSTCSEVALNTRHLLAVDDGRATLRGMLEAVTSEMGTGEIVTMSEDETLLLSDAELFQVHQAMEPAAADVLLRGHWLARGGLPANASMLCEQFKQAKGVRPLRLIIGGPPLSGKTRLAEELSSYYSVPLIDMELALREGLDLSVEQGGSEEWAELVTEGEEGCKVYPALKDVPDAVLRGIMQRKLSSKDCVCRGWILDNFPTTRKLAEAIFAVPPPEVPEGEEAPPKEEGWVPDLEEAFLPSKVVWLECDDEYLLGRLQAIEEDQRVQGYTNDDETFQTHIVAWRELQEGKTPEPVGKPVKGAPPPEIEISSWDLFQKALPEGCCVAMAPGSWPDTSEACRELLGAPANFKGPGHLLSDDWVPPVVEEVIDEPLPMPAKIAAIRKRNADVIKNQAAADEIHENNTLYEGALPLRQHLLETVMPAVTEALVLLCEEQPEDSVDYVRKFLFDFEERQNAAAVARAKEVQAKAKLEKTKEKAEAEKVKREKGQRK